MSKRYSYNYSQKNSIIKLLLSPYFNIYILTQTIIYRLKLERKQTKYYNITVYFCIKYATISAVNF